MRLSDSLRYGLSETELQTLGTYNSEVARGIMHTPEWKEQMKTLQHTYTLAITLQGPDQPKDMETL